MSTREAYNRYMADDPSYSPYAPPPHANAEIHKRLVEWFDQATPEEKFQTLVDAGILTPEGEFTEHYRTDSDESASPLLQAPQGS